MNSIIRFFSSQFSLTYIPRWLQLKERSPAAASKSFDCNKPSESSSPANLLLTSFLLFSSRSFLSLSFHNEDRNCEKEFERRNERFTRSNLLFVDISVNEKGKNNLLSAAPLHPPLRLTRMCVHAGWWNYDSTLLPFFSSPCFSSDNRRLTVANSFPLHTQLP